MARTTIDGNGGGEAAAFRAARRDFLSRCAGGLGLVAAGTLLDPSLAAAAAPAGGDVAAFGGTLARTHLAPRAKRVDRKSVV